MCFEIQKPNVFWNSIFKAWADNPVCELIDVLTIILETNHYIKTISHFDNYNDQLIDAVTQFAIDEDKNKDVKFYLIHSHLVVIKLSLVVYYRYIIINYYSLIDYDWGESNMVQLDED